MLELFIRYYKTKDIALRNILVKQNYNLARNVAHKAKKLCSEPYEDLEQEASIGLIKAVEKYNPTLGHAFSSFATPYVHGKILQYLRDKGYLIRLPQSTQSWEMQRKKALKKLEEKLNRTPTIKEVSQYLNVSEKDYISNYQAIRNTRYYVSLDSLEWNTLSDSSFFICDEEKQSVFLPIIQEELRNNEIEILSKKNSSKKKLWYKIASTLPTYDNTSTHC